MKANKYFPVIAAAALSLASCSQDEELAAFAGHEIQIEVMTENQSRAVTSYCSGNLPEEFMLRAVLNTTNQVYIPGTKVVRSGNTYTFTGEKRYWPTDAMRVEAWTNDNNTYSAGKFVNYRVATDAAEQLDLIYAVSPAAVESDGAVKLNFRHALSQVAFQGSLDNHAVNIQIREIGIGGISGLGTYTFPTDYGTDENWLDSSHTGATTAVPTTGIGSWEVYNMPEEFTAKVTRTLNVPSGVSTWSWITSIPSSHSGDWSNVLTLMPQNVPAWDPANPTAGGAYVVIDACVSNVDAKYGALTTVYDGKFYLPIDINWQQGVRYIYNLRFGEGDNAYDDLDNPNAIATAISVDVTVDDFLPEHSDINTAAEEFETKDIELTYPMFDDTYQLTQKAYLYTGHWHVVCPTTEHVVVPEGCEFLGWSTVENSTEAMAGPGEAICLKEVTADLSDSFTSLTLYPVFVKYFTVNFSYSDKELYLKDPDLNGTLRYKAAANAESLEITLPDYYDVIKNGADRKKYNFLGWRLTVTTTAQYWEPDATYTLTEPETTFYSKWIAK